MLFRSLRDLFLNNTWVYSIYFERPLNEASRAGVAEDVYQCYLPAAAGVYEDYVRLFWVSILAQPYGTLHYYPCLVDRLVHSSSGGKEPGVISASPVDHQILEFREGEQTRGPKQLRGFSVSSPC